MRSLRTLRFLMTVALRWFGRSRRPLMAAAALAGTLALSQGAAFAHDEHDGRGSGRGGDYRRDGRGDDWRQRARAQDRWEDARRHDHYARRAAEARWRHYHHHHHPRYWR